MYIPYIIVFLALIIGWETIKYFRDVANDKEEELRQARNNSRRETDNSWMYQDSDQPRRKKLTPEDKEYFRDDWKI
ncbi:hypothetical protein H6768_00915 [Candidatus Peribacteria bacterium]|nr:hypothetical protein [Candidatus Peribacteria bacterium]